MVKGYLVNRRGRRCDDGDMFSSVLGRSSDPGSVRDGTLRWFTSILCTQGGVGVGNRPREKSFDIDVDDLTIGYNVSSVKTVKVAAYLAYE